MGAARYVIEKVAELRPGLLAADPAVSLAIHAASEPRPVRHWQDRVRTWWPPGKPRPGHGSPGAWRMSHRETVVTSHASAVNVSFM